MVHGTEYRGSYVLVRRYEVLNCTVLLFSFFSFFVFSFCKEGSRLFVITAPYCKHLRAVSLSLYTNHSKVMIMAKGVDMKRANAATAAVSGNFIAESGKDCEHVLKIVGSVPPVVRDACLARGWSIWDEQSMHAHHWHLCWRNGGFKPSEITNANGFQRINHFLKSKVIKRKDSLERALRKLRGVHGSIYNFSPASFILPGEYTKVVHEYSKQETKQIWICKPSNSSRGRKSE